SSPITGRDVDLVQQTFARVAMLGSNTIGRLLFMPHGQIQREVFANIFKIAPGAVDLFPFAKGDANMWRPGSALECHALK
ncbi:unnamed protein product, partial [Effrenium voratum]